MLLTRFLRHDGIAELTDFMPVECDESAIRPKLHQIIRIMLVVRGRIRFRLECRQAFNFGRDAHRVMVRPQGAVF